MHFWKRFIRLSQSQGQPRSQVQPLRKRNPKTTFYRDYDSFNQTRFEGELKSRMKSLVVLSFFRFQIVFLETLNNSTPNKTKYFLRYYNPFMTKTLRKAIMTRSRCKNKFNEKRFENNWSQYKKQRNFCMDLPHKAKRECFNNLKILKTSDNKTKFWTSWIIIL